MRAPVVPLRHKLITLFATCLLTCGLLPMLALADDSQNESVAGGFTPPEYENDAQSASPNSNLPSTASGNGARGAILASSLAPNGTSIVSADVALDADEPIIGSFTLDGLTYAVDPDGLTLVAVGASAVSDGAIAVPAIVAYGGMAYDVIAIGPYAFYLSGATSVELPASVASVDDRAFRSSDVERVSVNVGNPNLTSFDGALYSADLSSLLLIPEGRAGAVLLPCEAEVAEPSKFSHCSLVDAISVEEGGAAFATWEGLLYDASGTTLLRAPAGATEITIRDGCTTIAAGALEGCAKLERINAPATVTSISPDLFELVPTVLPSYELVGVDGVSPLLNGGEYAALLHIYTLVDLAESNGGLRVDPTTIAVLLPNEADRAPWEYANFSIEQIVVAGLDSSSTFNVATSNLRAPGGTIYYYAPDVTPNGQSRGSSCGYVWEKATVIDAYVYLATNQSYKFTATRNGIGNIGWSTSENGSAYRGTLNAGSTLYAIWRKYSISWNANGGNCPTASASVIAGDRSTAPSPTRSGYTFNGWFTASNGGSRVCGANEATPAITSNVTYYAQWTGNTITLTWNPNGGNWSESEESTTTMQTYSTTATLALKVAPFRAGYTFTGWWTAVSGGSQVTTSTALPISNSTYYAQWIGSPITCTWSSQGGSSIDDTSATYSPSAKVPLPSSNPTKAGYVFTGWWTAASGGSQVTSATPLPTSDPTYYAHWTPAVSADVPLQVTARVDLLGIEEQSPASGYIESRCGEPLAVAGIDMEPLAGAATVFGANTGSVLLEAYADEAASPFASFALDAAATESDPTALAPLAMAAYGDHVPIRYRFDMPDDLLSALAETAEPVGLCQVSYTVALA